MVSNNTPKTFNNSSNVPQKVWISILVFIAIIVAFSLFLIRPLFLSIAEDAKELFDGKTSIFLRTEEIKNLQSNKVFYESNQESLLRIEEQFVSADIPIDLITFLEDSTISSGVKIDISPGTTGTQSKDAWPTFNLLLSVEGSSAGLLKFLDKLENGQYFIDISSLSIGTVKKGELEERTVEAINAALSIKALVKK